MSVSIDMRLLYSRGDSRWDGQPFCPDGQHKPRRRPIACAPGESVPYVIVEYCDVCCLITKWGDRDT